MDAIGRRTHACPFPCEGYEPERSPQEVPLVGGEWWRGDVCPGSVVFGDPTVCEILMDLRALDTWAGANTLAWWRRQPAWWTDGVLECRRVRDIIEREAADAG